MIILTVEWVKKMASRNILAAEAHVPAKHLDVADNLCVDKVVIKRVNDLAAQMSQKRVFVPKYLVQASEQLDFTKAKNTITQTVGDHLWFEKNDVREVVRTPKITSAGSIDICPRSKTSTKTNIDRHPSFPKPVKTLQKCPQPQPMLGKVKKTATKPQSVMPTKADKDRDPFFPIHPTFRNEKAIMQPVTTKPQQAVAKRLKASQVPTRPSSWNSIKRLARGADKICAKAVRTQTSVTDLCKNAEPKNTMKVNKIVITPKIISDV